MGDRDPRHQRRRHVMQVQLSATAATAREPGNEMEVDGIMLAANASATANANSNATAAGAAGGETVVGGVMQTATANTTTATMGEPGDEMWIDGIMERFVEKRTKKAEDRKEERVIGAAVAGMRLSSGNCSSASDTAGKPCAPGCTDRGNCNTEDGRCECAIGYGGARDITACLPACVSSFLYNGLLCFLYLRASV